jgi:hypothetical protein
VARLYVDEDISRALVELLRSGGHDVLTADEAGNRSAPDQTHLLVAAQLRRLLVTYNARDFRLLHGAWLEWSEAWAPRPSPEHGGILILRQPPRLTDVQASREIDLVANAGGTLANQLLIWTPSRSWIRA